MPEDASHERNRDDDEESHRPTTSADRSTGSSMRARTWVIAALYEDPVEYGIPELPTWAVTQTPSGGVALSATPDSEPFISAEQPTTVRR